MGIWDVEVIAPACEFWQVSPLTAAERKRLHSLQKQRSVAGARAETYRCRANYQSDKEAAETYRRYLNWSDRYSAVSATLRQFSKSLDEKYKEANA